jgi:hypothetical protein
MVKKKDQARTVQIMRSLEKMTSPSLSPAHAEDEVLNFDSLGNQPVKMVADSAKSLRMKKFRTQLLYQWLVSVFEPCRVADVGGGKGLLSFLLANDGWQAVVIDPFDQSLPDKYKDLSSGQRVKIGADQSVRRITTAFQVEMARDFDLLVGMHAHGCNAKIIDASVKYGCGFVLFPCCVIDEPFFPRLGVQWIECLADYAIRQGKGISPFRLNFKGQNIGLVHTGKCKLRHNDYEPISSATRSN